MSLSRRTILQGLLMSSAAAALAACGDTGGQGAGGTTGADDVQVSSVVAQRSAREFHRGNADEPGSLDPHKTEGTWESSIVSDMLMGLFQDDADAKPIPGAAESHTVSEDGLVWTFRMREHAWSDGVPVTAEDFVFAWRRILDPRTAARYAKILYPFKNAQKINAGELPPEALGARAIDARTLELTLENPAPYLPELLTHQTTFPVPKHKVETLGDAWSQAGNYVSNGAFVLAEWRPNDHVRLVKNPKFYDAATVQLDTVYFYPTSDQPAALRRFRAGELDVNDGIPIGQIDWIRQNLPGAAQLEPFLAVNYIITNTTRAPFDDRRVRQAVAMVLDRETISDKVIRLGELAAYTFVPPGTANYPGTAQFRWASMPYGDRVTEAQRLMQEAGFGDAKRVSVKFNTGPGPDNRRIAATMQQMLASIFIDAEILQSDSAVHYDLLQEANFDMATAAWVGDYNDAKNFMFLLLSTNTGFNYGRWKNAEYDALYAAAEREKDAVKRGELQNQAVQLALDEVAIIPNRFLNTRNLVQPYVKGWKSNLSDENRSRWISIEGPRIPAGQRPAG